MRTVSDRSQGTNTTTKFAPGALKLTAALFNLPFDYAKEMIEYHLRWLRFPRGPIEFTSWTSSLLFALQLAVYRAHGKRESNIRICIVDTRKAKEASFYPARSLLQIYGVKNEGKLSYEYYGHEYLLHGEMKNTGSYSIVSLEDLAENGLYELLSELKDTCGFNSLFLRVQDLRSSFFEHPRSIHGDLAVCIKLGVLFRAQFIRPATIAFLTLHKRSERDKLMLQAIFVSMSKLRFLMREDVEGFSYNHHGTDVKGLGEVVQLFDLLHDIAVKEMKQSEQSVARRQIDNDLTLSMQRVTCKFLWWTQGHTDRHSVNQGEKRITSALQTNDPSIDD
jgi:hypothetical protein